ncbi:hypothetical protein B0H19DRAFT_1107473 [Mycena capillaripes]|nr:hypothetical protein B0H19DRAFT_1107473 [Mycena capillaripes]
MATVVLTGASGFIGSHIADLLLRNQYHVRAVSRKSKINSLKETFAHYGTSFEPFEVNDLCDTLPSELFANAQAVIHVASPLPARETFDTMLKVSREGSLNIIRSAHAAGVKKFVVTGSVGSAWHDDVGPRITGDDWSPVTEAEARSSGDPMVQYTFSKTYAEKAVWAFAETHPDIDVTTILPPLVYGPYIFEQTWATSPDYNALSTDIYIYNLLEPNGVFPPHPRFIDVRDLAELHLLSLTTPADSKQKRLVIASPDVLNLNAYLQQLREQWPARVNQNKPPPFGDQVIGLVFDYGRTEEVTGMKRSAFRGANETFADTVASLLALEKVWESKGYDVSHIPPFV